MLTIDLKQEQKKNANLIGVGLPCFIKDDEKAISCLGSKEILLNTIEQNEYKLSFQFPTRKAVNSRLEGIVSATSKNIFAVKLIRRRKKNSTEDNGECRVEFLGMVNKFINFDQPIDYQFLPSKIIKKNTSMEVDELSSNLHQLINLKSDILEILPEKIDRNDDYLKRQSSYCLSFKYLPTDYLVPATNSTVTNNLTSPMKQATEHQLDATKNKEIENNDNNNEIEEQTKSSTPKRKVYTVTNPSYTDAQGKKRSLSYAVVIRFQDSIPTSHPWGECPEKWRHLPKTFRGHVMIDRLRRLFDIIPSKCPNIF